MARASRWVFDPNSSMCSCTAMGVDIEFTRLKNPKTHKEQLRITIIDNGVEAGSFICSPADIEGGLQMLREFGVMIQRADKTDIRGCVDENYKDIKMLLLNSKESMEEDVIELYEYICQYIKDEMDKGEDESAVFFKQDAYNMTIETFNKMMVGNTYEMSNEYFRARFAQLGLTLFDKGRTARTMRVKSEDKKNKKCVSFKKTEADEKMEELGIVLPVTAVTEE